MSGHLVSGGHRVRRTSHSSAEQNITTWARRIALMAAATLFAIPETANAQHFWNWGGPAYREPPPVFEPARPRRAKIKRKSDPAEVIAKNAAKPVGPLVIAVSVEKQRVKVYDSNGLFAEAPVSTGTKSHPTPYGVFSIIQKNRHHISNLYNASMPYMQRITWSGVAMHTGPLPGYAASHGCIRLPNEFAARLWTWTKMGTRVIVAPGEVAPSNFSHPKLIARMVPPPTISSASAPAPAAVVRTADAREVIEGMKGTLSDVTSAPAQETKATENEAKPGETERSEAKAVEPAAEPKHVGIDTAVDTPGTLPGDTKTETAEKAGEKPLDETARNTLRNSDDSENTAMVAEPAAPKTEEKQAEPKAAEAAPAIEKPADAAQAIAKPADTIKPLEQAKPTGIAAPPAKPAEVAAPTATPTPEMPKPVVTAPPRRYNHVAVFISRKDKRLYVRHGYEPVYDVPIEITDPERPLGTHVFTARGDKDDAHALHWSVVSLPRLARKTVEPRRNAREAAAARKPTKPATVVHSVVPPLNAAEALDRITVPDEALEKIAAIISPGGSILISDHGLNGWETGKGTDFIVPLR